MNKKSLSEVYQELINAHPEHAEGLKDEILRKAAKKLEANAPLSKS